MKLKRIALKPKQKLRISRAFLVALCLLVCGWFLGTIMPSVTGRNLGTIQIGEAPFVPAQQNNITVFLYFHDLLGISIKSDVYSITLPPYTEKTLCVQNLHFREQTVHFPQPYDNNPFIGSAHGRGFHSNPSYGFKDFCTGVQHQTIFFYENTQQDERVEFGDRSNTIEVSSSSSYYFPFDRQVLDVNVWLDGQTLISDTTGNSVVIAPEIVGFVNVPEWDETITIQKEFSEERGYDVTHIHIDFKRPLTFRLLTVISLAALAFLTIVLAFVEDKSSFLEVAIAILLGLWGIQNIIIPDDLTDPTIITPIILFLYCLLAFSVFIRFVIRPVWKWLGTRFNLHPKKSLRRGHPHRRRRSYRRQPCPAVRTQRHLRNPNDPT